MKAGADEILTFWFADANDGPAQAQARQAFWFRGSAEVDEAIRGRFMPTVEAALRGELEPWSDVPGAALALVLLLDQFPRNAWRGTARAFSGDALALATARAAVGAGFLERLELAQRAFMILPFEHSESLADQHESMRLFAALASAAPGRWRALFDGYLDYARQHCEIIERFGRFPHRNRVLGRETTPEERAWLDGGGAVFGQG
ncbi:MAG: DUF924 family protein [Steroidobacteraceae bacterium]